MRTFCHAAACAEFNKSAGAPTFDGILLDTLASIPEENWIKEYQDIAETYMGEHLDRKDAHETAVLDDIRKQANGKMLGMLPALAGKGAALTPTAIKALIASGVALGTAGGGLYWGLKRSINEDAESGLDVMQAKVDEYQKINRMLQEESDGQNLEEEQMLANKIQSY